MRAAISAWSSALPETMIRTGPLTAIERNTRAAIAGSSSANAPLALALEHRFQVIGYPLRGAFERPGEDLGEAVAFRVDDPLESQAPGRHRMRDGGAGGCVQRGFEIAFVERVERGARGHRTVDRAADGGAEQRRFLRVTGVERALGHPRGGGDALYGGLFVAVLEEHRKRGVEQFHVPCIGLRAVGRCRRAVDMMLERAVSRRTRGRKLGDHQFVQGLIADSEIQLEQFRMLVLKTAWLIDEVEAGREPHGKARQHIAMCKVAMAAVLQDIIGRAVQLHGSLGITYETFLGPFLAGVSALAFADGPTDVHRAVSGPRARG